jgi:hypothetical protein
LSRYTYFDTDMYQICVKRRNILHKFATKCKHFSRVQNEDDQCSFGRHLGDSCACGGFVPGKLYSLYCTVLYSNEVPFFMGWPECAHNECFILLLADFLLSVIVLDRHNVDSFLL